MNSEQLTRLKVVREDYRQALLSKGYASDSLNGELEDYVGLIEALGVSIDSEIDNNLTEEQQVALYNSDGTPKLTLKDIISDSLTETAKVYEELGDSPIYGKEQFFGSTVLSVPTPGGFAANSSDCFNGASNLLQIGELRYDEPERYPDGYCLIDLSETVTNFYKGLAGLASLAVPLVIVFPTDRTIDCRNLLGFSNAPSVEFRNWTTKVSGSQIGYQSYVRRWYGVRAEASNAMMPGEVHFLPDVLFTGHYVTGNRVIYSTTVSTLLRLLQVCGTRNPSREPFITDSSLGTVVEQYIELLEVDSDDETVPEEFKTEWATLSQKLLTDGYDATLEGLKAWLKAKDFYFTKEEAEAAE